MIGEQLDGQWLGQSKGQPDGDLVLDAETRNGAAFAVAKLFVSDQSVPSSVAYIDLSDRRFGEEFYAKIRPFVWSQGRQLSTLQLRQEFPDVQHAEKASFVFRLVKENELIVDWKTELETHGTAHLLRSKVGKRSKLKPDPEVSSWADFREWTSKREFREFIYRGQSKAYPLQTSFHRTGRKILEGYHPKDITELHRFITPFTNHLFDLNDHHQLGAFVSLLQHHGYPTPLLDWSYSPFVASWFAFSTVDPVEPTSEPIRVYALNKKLFEILPQNQTITLAPKHVSILETLAIENSRIIPQQGLLTLTNVHDVESYLQDLEEIHNQRFL